MVQTTPTQATEIKLLAIYITELHCLKTRLDGRLVRN